MQGTGGSGPGTEHNPSPTSTDDVEAQLEKLLEEADLDLDADGKLRVIVSTHGDDPPHADVTLSTLLQTADLLIDADDHLQVDVQDLLSISDDPPNLDLAITGLRDALRGPSDKTLTDVISDIRGGSSKTLTTLETDVEALLAQSRFNDVFGEVAAAPTTNTVLDRLRQIQETDFATEATLSGQLDITLSALRDALRGADGDDLTVVHGELETITSHVDELETLIDQQTPEAKAALFDTAVNASSDILANNGAAAVSPTDSPTHFRVFVAVDTSTVFSAMLDQGGATTHELELNAGTALQPGALYRFTVPARQGDNVDFQVDDACTVQRLTVDEVTAAL